MTLIQRFGSALDLNGPAAARRWLPATPLDLDAWLENILFNETRAYVQRVLWHALVFDWLENKMPRELPWTSGSIRPAGGEPAQ